jgi:hypothetical protein
MDGHGWKGGVVEGDGDGWKGLGGGRERVRVKI